VGAAAAYIEEFLVESNENLSSIGSELLNYEKDGSREVLDNIYRKVHTLKGSAGFLGFKKLQKITHTAENLLDLMREEKLQLNSELVDALLKTFDICNSILQVIADNGEEGNPDVDGIGSLLESLSNPDQGSLEVVKESPDREVHQPIVEDSMLMDGDLNRLTSKDATAPVAETKVEATPVVEAKVEPTPTPVVKEEVKVEPVVKEEVKVEKKSESVTKEQPKVAPLAAKAAGADKSSVIDSVVRVNVNLLDKIMNLVGELVLSRNQIVQFSNSYQDNRLVKLTHDLNVITSDLQTEIMNTRMQPVGNVLSKFERLVRDLSRSQKKNVSFSIIGKETELDRTLLEAIKDPLTHIVRNSMDHGLEGPDERKANGKSEQGFIRIRAFHEGGYVAIEIKDDGRGINKTKVLAKAIEKGILTEDEAKTWTDKQIYNLIFNAGFSTAEKVTNISGRGVGMDVVRTNIEKIGGNVIVESEEGKGSTFKLRIPLTLAIIPALIVKSRDQYFAIPQLNLSELIRIDNKSRQVESIKGSEFLRLREELIPIVRLDSSLNVDTVQKRSNEFNHEEVGLVGEEVDAIQEGESVIILKADGQTYGLVVDDILDTEEIVVKPLDQTFKNIKAFAGATLMGDGRVALILDPLGLWISSGFVTDKGDSATEHLEEDSMNEKLNKNELLLFSLADERKYAIPISSVFRLEEFGLDKLSRTGDQVLVKYNGKPMALVNIEKTLGYSAQSNLVNSQDLQFIKAIVVKQRDRLFGLVVSDILDISLTDERLSSEMADRDGVSGTIFIDEQTVTVLDTTELIVKSGLIKNLTATNSGQYGKFKLAIAEDSQLHQKLLENTLEPLGVQYKIFDNGRDALKGIMNEEYDLIITDIEMPHMNGFDLVDEVRKSGKYNDTPIIAITTRVSEKDLERGKGVGISRHLEKLDKKQVTDVVSNFLNQIKEGR
jgi:two-component system chemotaxis sensor kinase CheA